jgi:aminoglycoside 3-N-acetyltransferase
MRSALDRLTHGGTDLMFVHASLSSCGQFTAGARDVITGLKEFCGTLSFPTHSYCYPPSSTEIAPLFDAKTTPSLVGLLSETFRTQPEVLRSIHATHSLAALGSYAEALCSGHYRQETPCGSATPYARLLQRRASVLMFGVSFHFYTLFHTAEDYSGSPYAYVPGTVDSLRVVDERGQEQVCQSRRQSRAPYRFEEAGYLLERVGLVRRVTLGRANLLYVQDCSQVHEFLLDRLKRTPNFLRQSCTSKMD